MTLMISAGHLLKPVMLQHTKPYHRDIFLEISLIQSSLMSDPLSTHYHVGNLLLLPSLLYQIPPASASLWHIPLLTDSICTQHFQHTTLCHSLKVGACQHNVGAFL